LVANLRSFIGCNGTVIICRLFFILWIGKFRKLGLTGPRPRWTYGFGHFLGFPPKLTYLVRVISIFSRADNWAFLIGTGTQNAGYIREGHLRWAFTLNRFIFPIFRKNTVLKPTDFNFARVPTRENFGFTLGGFQICPFGGKV